MALAAACIELLAGQSFAQTNPIPGIDIVVRKQPGGSAITVVTDKEGRFAFTGLKAGTYRLSATPSGRAKGLKGSRLNRQQAAVTEGKGVIKVAVAFGPAEGGREKRDGGPVTVVVPRGGARITGTVVSSDTQKDVDKFLRIEGHIGKAQKALSPASHRSPQSHGSAGRD